MPMLLVGCDGGTNATSGVVPEITKKLYDLTTAGKIDEARVLQAGIAYEQAAGWRIRPPL